MAILNSGINSSPHRRRRYVPEGDGAEAVVSEVPSGTIPQVLEWVGDDLDRAADALAAEQSGEGRVSLVERLESMLTEPAPDTDNDPDAEADAEV